jgi:uncharacterized membrane protein
VPGLARQQTPDPWSPARPTHCRAARRVLLLERITLEGIKEKSMPAVASATYFVTTHFKEALIFINTHNEKNTQKTTKKPK